MPIKYIIIFLIVIEFISSNLKAQTEENPDPKPNLTKDCEDGKIDGCYKLALLEQKNGNEVVAKRFFGKACGGGHIEACSILVKAQSVDVTESKKEVEPLNLNHKKTDTVHSKKSSK